MPVAEVFGQAAGVRQQVPHRHGLGRVRIGEPELGQVADDGRVKVEQPFIDELHGERRGPHLGNGPDLPQRVGRCLDPGDGVEQAAGRLDDVVVVRLEAQDAEGRSGNVVLLGQRGQASSPVIGVDGHRVTSGHANLLITSQLIMYYRIIT